METQSKQKIDNGQVAGQQPRLVWTTLGDYYSHNGRKVMIDAGCYGLSPLMEVVIIAQNPVVVPQPREAVMRSELRPWPNAEVSYDDSAEKLSTHEYKSNYRKPRSRCQR